MKRTLLRRVEQLEALRPKQERRISSVRYATPWRGRKVPEGTVLPPGARVILDFERFCSVPSWRGHGIKYEAGILHQRITTDPNDQGRVLEKGEKVGELTAMRQSGLAKTPSSS